MDTGAVEELLRVPNYFDWIGWVVEQQQDPVEAIDATLGPLILAEWSRWSPVVAELRALTADPALFHGFELLAKRISDRRE